jgi:hypothetical protein
MNKPSRRAVVRTGVWAVPAVATVAAAPAFAGSGTVTIDSTGAACKIPGESSHDETTYKGYRMVLTFHNPSGSAQNITITDFQITGATVSAFTPTAFAVPTGDSTKLFIVTSTTSSQRTATVTYAVDGVVQPPVVISFDSFNPCKCDPKDADPSDPASNCS